MSPLVVAIGVVAGLAWGFVADRLAARWPAHADGAIRLLDWRTVAQCTASLHSKLHHM